MRIRVQFASGEAQDFVVSEDMLYDDFVNMAYAVGGKIRKLEYL